MEEQRVLQNSDFSTKFLDPEGWVHAYNHFNESMVPAIFKNKSRSELQNSKNFRLLEFDDVHIRKRNLYYKIITGTYCEILSYIMQEPYLYYSKL